MVYVELKSAFDRPTPGLPYFFDLSFFRSNILVISAVTY
jgi:hypothetical protein